MNSLLFSSNFSFPIEVRVAWASDGDNRVNTPAHRLPLAVGTPSQKGNKIKMILDWV